MAVLLFWGGCSEEHGENEAGGVVSLAPAVTRAVVDLGMGDRLVGVASHDASAAADLPVVGGYQEADVERIVGLRPAMVLRMSGGEDAALTAAVEAVGGQVHTLSDPRSVQDVLEMVTRLGELLGEAEAAAALEQRITQRLAAVRDAAVSTDGHRPRVLLLLDPAGLMAIGPRATHHELLEWVGGVNAVGDAVVSAPVLDAEAVVAARPEVIVLLVPGGPELGAWEQDERLAALRGLPVPAVQRRRVHVLNDPLVLLPSTNIADTAEALAAAIREPTG